MKIKSYEKRTAHEKRVAAQRLKARIAAWDKGMPFFTPETNPARICKTLPEAHIRQHVQLKTAVLLAAMNGIIWRLR